MEIGTAIFLSSIVLALVGLYAVTKDRWAWRQTLKRVAQEVRREVFVLVAVLVVFVAVIILASIGYQHWEQLTAAKLPDDVIWPDAEPAATSAAKDGPWTAYSKAKPPAAKPARQIEYAGLRLGMTQDEVMYVKGMPSHVLAPDTRDPQLKDRYTFVETKDWEGREKEKRIKGYKTWAFHEWWDNTIQVSFSKAENPYHQFDEPQRASQLKLGGAVSNIRCRSEENTPECPTIVGIEGGDSEEKVNRTLGPPTRSRIDGVYKILTYDDTGVMLVLTKKRVFGFAIGTLAAETDR